MDVAELSACARAAAVVLAQADRAAKDAALEAMADCLAKAETAVLEANAIPGLTDTSLLPMAAEAAGLGFERLCDRCEAEVLACTHTGLHWHRVLPSGRHVVNAGAIGRPAHDGRPGAWYAELDSREGELDVTFHHVAYDPEPLARRMLAAGLPPEFIATVRSGWWTTCFGNMPGRERLRADDAQHSPGAIR